MSDSYRYTGWRINHNPQRGDDKISPEKRRQIIELKRKRDLAENMRICSDLGIFDLSQEVIDNP